MKNTEDELKQSRLTSSQSILITLAAIPIAVLAIRKLIKIFQFQTRYPPIVIKDGSLKVDSDNSLDNDSTGPHDPQRPHRRKHHDGKIIRRVKVKKDGNLCLNERFDPGEQCTIDVFWFDDTSAADAPVQIKGGAFEINSQETLERNLDDPAPSGRYFYRYFDLTVKTGRVVVKRNGTPLPPVEFRRNEQCKIIINEGDAR